MQAILRRIPSLDDIAHHKAKIAGFAAGILGTLLLSLFFGVLYSGHGIFTDPEPGEVVYPNF